MKARAGILLFCGEEEVVLGAKVPGKNQSTPTDTHSQKYQAQPFSLHLYVATALLHITIVHSCRCIIFHGVKIPHLGYPFYSPWAFGQFSVWGYYE